ncbi:DUF6745 domain-containing protein [Nocardia jinanensis]|uniref:DUF6745 domain-containing protein n=1 Tax=Nocardia jinanensis TaxID=382504 RepID=A0A917RSX2_9NOCA|nr:hypothetical protein [Nocardia jinanensis]GGL24442.1 hypothetical protein GCM10011588_44030 [Nocardia jinanensis]
MTEYAKWRALSAVTGPGDRAAAERGVRLAYERAGLRAPERIRWARSPLDAVRMLSAEALSGEAGASVRERVRSAPWAAERDRLHTALGAREFARHWQATGAGLWELTEPVVSRIRDGVVAAVAPGSAEPADEPELARPAGQEELRARLLLLDAVMGQHDAAWLCAFDTAPGTPLEGLAAVAREAGWWWPYENLAVISERPTALYRDEAGRLDRADGPAVGYSDDFALYAWRGMPVPGDFLAGLASLTADRIRTEENAELRRVMLEFYGYDRYLAESGAEPVQRDETGILWRIPLTDDEDVVMVEVVNSTPEPDGTSRTYWLRVPPTTRTAREGVAWTFGVTEADYEPLVQT